MLFLVRMDSFIVGQAGVHLGARLVHIGLDVVLTLGRHRIRLGPDVGSGGLSYTWGVDMAWLRICFKGKNAIRWLNISRVTDVYIDNDIENPRATFYSGSDVMLSLVFSDDGDDVQVQWYDDRDAVVVMKWDLEELYEGKVKEVLMGRLVENA